MSQTTASRRWTLTGKMRMTQQHTRKRRRMKKDPRHSHLRTRGPTQPLTTSWKCQVLHNDLHLRYPRLNPRNDRFRVRRQHLRREGNCPSRAAGQRLLLHRPNRSHSQSPVQQMKKRRVKQMTTSYEHQAGKSLGVHGHRILLVGSDNVVSLVEFKCSVVGLARPAAPVRSFLIPKSFQEWKAYTLVSYV